MLRCLQLVWVFLVLTHHKVSAVSRVYSAGGNSVLNANGYSISQGGNTLYCGSLTCNGAVNCEITQYGWNVNQKCTDYNLNVISQRAFTASGHGDVELYFGPAYKKQAEEQAKLITDKVNSQINSAFENAFSGFPFTNNAANQNSAILYGNSNGPLQSIATYKNAMSSLTMLCVFLVSQLR